MNVSHIPMLASLFLRHYGNQWMDDAELREDQLRRLRRILEHAFTHVPFYREMAAERGLSPERIHSLEDLPLLPVITRETVQKNHHLLLSEEGDRARWFRSKSSGSTGEPLEVAFDPPCWIASRYVLKWRSLLATGFPPFGKVVVIRAVEPNLLEDKWKQLRLPLEDWLKRRCYLSTFDPPEMHLEFYRRFRPGAIHGPPSYFLGLADALHRRPGASLKVPRILCTTELLDSRSRRFISEAFDAEVFDIYGSSEFKDVAWECPVHEGYHINADNVIVEVVQDGAPVPPGTEGDIVLTTLSNRAMPLIRYRVGDRGVLSEDRCSCGRTLPLMKCIEGRIVDYIHSPGGRKTSPYQLVNRLEEIPEVRRFQIHQQEDYSLHINLVVSRRDGDLVSAKVEQILSEVVGAALPIRTHVVDSIRTPPGRKFRLVLSDVSEEKTDRP